MNVCTWICEKPTHTHIQVKIMTINLQFTERKNRFRFCLFITYLANQSIHLFLCYVLCCICSPWLQNDIVCVYVVVMSIDIPLWRLTSQLTVKPYQLSTLRVHIMSHQYIAFSSQVTQWFQLPQGISYFWKCSVYFLRGCQYKSPRWLFWQQTKKQL